jgi:hypothetical protein
MKRYTLFLLTSLVLTSANFAFPPKKCPSVRRIQNAQFRPMPMEATPHTFDVYQPSNYYHTKKFWGFRIDAINAISEEVAIEIAKADTASLTFTSGPIAMGTPQDRWWRCEYTAASGHKGIAITDN